MSELYSQNKTMALLGYQVSICAGTVASNGIHDIINAYASTEKEYIAQRIIQLFQKGFLFTLLSNVYTLGVIAGKREERKRKKEAAAKRNT